MTELEQAFIDFELARRKSIWADRAYEDAKYQRTLAQEAVQAAGDHLMAMRAKEFNERHPSCILEITRL